MTTRKYYINNLEKILARAKLYYIANREKIRARSNLYYIANREQKLAYESLTRGKSYGVSIPTWWLCDICNKPISIGAKTKGTKIELDHNHSTGQFRGWLCHGCNTTLGGIERVSLSAFGEYLLR